MTRRQQIIEEVLVDLEYLRKKNPQGSSIQYAIEENMHFFKAVRHPLSFLKWQLFRAPHINASRLLELADLPLPKWEAELYEGLQWIERKKIPGLLVPLCNELIESSGLVFLDVGCGAMETERQVIEQLQKNRDTLPRIFIGVDQSSSTYDAVQKTFADLKNQVEITRLTNLEKRSLNKVLKRGSKHRIIFIEADALTLKDNLSSQSVDVAFSSRFMHHLPDFQKKQMIENMKKVGRLVLEYDDYRTNISWIPQTLAAWSRPVLLNGALLSRIRQPTKRSLKESGGTAIRFFSPPGVYVKILQDLREN